MCDFDGGRLLQGMKQGRTVRLRQEREIRGWSRSYIAEQVEVDLGTVGRWERGERLPHPHYRQKLCDLFGKSAQELGLLPDEMDEYDGSIAMLDPLPQAPSTDAQSTAQPSPAAKQAVSTLQQADMSLPETLHVERKPAAEGKALSLANQQNRQRMLKKMYSFWIKGVLEQSLYGGELVGLNLIEQGDAVTDPWTSALQQPEVGSGLLLTDKHISQIYDEVDGELLILGEPGSGKTTLLLELTRILLERANQEEKHPIPVVFNLTSWAVKRPALGDWLVEELRIKYQVPRKLAQAWVQAEQILPLLDGLDEVAVTARSACVETINTYRREHGLLPMVVCCRRDDYFAQDTRLLLRCGMLVQPLTSQQIEVYLTDRGERLAALHHALQMDPTLQELASSPLMLSILALTYQNKTVDVHAETLSLEARRREVIANYIRRTLSHRKSRNRYSAKQTQYWLNWLARQLVQQEQTEFYIERMQPSWLPDTQAFRWYCRLLVGLLVGMFGGIAAMLGDVPLYELVQKQIFSFLHTPMTAAQCIDMLLSFKTPTQSVASIVTPLVVVPLYGIGFGVLGMLFAWKWPRSQFTEKRTGRSVFYQHGLALLLGLACGSVFVVINLLGKPCPLTPGTLYLQIAQERSYAAGGVLVGGLLGLLTADLFGAEKAQIQPVEALVWARVPMRRRVIASLLGGALGSLVGGGMEVASLAFLHPTLWQKYFPVSVLAGGLLGLALGWGIGSLSRHMLEKSSLVKPNEGILRSLRNGLILGLPIGLVLGCVLPLILALWLIPGDLGDGLLWFFPLGLLASLALFLLNGGYACLQHVILRVILYRRGFIPWDYARFLDDAADRLLLRKVGGGYMFTHRLLLDYFASL